MTNLVSDLKSARRESFVCYPRVWDSQAQDDFRKFRPNPAANPAKVFEFQLYPFQRESIDCLERGEHVFVSAHPSAGKTTVIAEYAVAMCIRSHIRVIYTSANASLVNHQYRELYEQFSDVGLMTGEVTINPTASCVVMSREVLRDLLLRRPNSDLMIEVSFVIFDDIDLDCADNGASLWEEAVLLLPAAVRLLLLSGVISNLTQLGDWIASLRNQPCNVISSEERHPPLLHYVVPAGATSLHFVMDDRGDLRDQSLADSLADLSQRSTGAMDGGQAGCERASLKDLTKVGSVLFERGNTPVLVVSFSDSDCEANALAFSNTNWASDEERQLISQIFESATEFLSSADQTLPQPQPTHRDSPARGARQGGVFYGRLRHEVECPSQDGGAYFSNKFDEDVPRTMNSGEYLRLSSHAGRRGLDDKGMVVTVITEPTEAAAVKAMLIGPAGPLNTSFVPTYYTYLNLLRRQEDPEAFAQRSFHQFQLQSRRNESEEIAALVSTLESVRMSKDEEKLLIEAKSLQSRENLTMPLCVAIQEMEKMKLILRRLEYTTDRESITDKGQMACEISSCNDLLCVELIIGGVFDDLPPEQTSALCSCLLRLRHCEGPQEVYGPLAQSFNKLRECARRVGSLILEAGVPIDVAKYVGSLKPDLMDIVLQWSEGALFADLCKRTSLSEGTIAQCIRDLEQLLTQMSKAAKAAGRSELASKFTASSEALRRDVVFAPSLYL